MAMLQGYWEDKTVKGREGLRICPPGYTKMVRTKGIAKNEMGEGYSLEDVLQRIEENGRYISDPDILNLLRSGSEKHACNMIYDRADVQIRWKDSHLYKSIAQQRFYHWKAAQIQKRLNALSYDELLIKDRNNLPILKDRYSKLLKTMDHLTENLKEAEDAYMEIVDATRSALTLKFTYSSDKTALIMHRNAFPIIPENGYDFPEVISDDYRYDKDPGDGKGWLYWFLDFRHNDPYQTRWPDFVNALAIPSLDPIKVSGYSPKTTYQFAYIAEDVNGVLGHVKTCSGTTLSNEGGSNPQIEKIEYSTASTGEVAFTFYANDDITTIYYMVATYQGGAGPAASDLRLDRLLDKNSSDYTGIKNAWQRTVLGEQGLSTSTNIQPRVTIPALDSELTVAIAYAYGTNDTESALATLIIDGEGNEYTLEEWYGMTVQYVTVPRY